ncbi:MAG: hypothetical protein ABR499_12285 [Gemmatimonadaceae bacterium]
MRPSYEALPSWLSRLPEVPPTPVMASRPPEDGVFRRALGHHRLRLPGVLFAVALGIGAAVAAGSVRAKHTAESRAEMSAFATRKVAELSAFGTLRSAPARALGSPLAPGGSVTDDVPGYSDVVEGTEGRRFRRRWAVDVDPSGHKRVTVRVIPATREAGRAPLDLTTVLAHR